MKKHLLFLAFATASLPAVAQSPAVASASAAPAVSAPAATTPSGYSDLLAATITDLHRTGDPALLKELASKFERASTVVATDWLPPYYQSYALLLTCFQSKEDGDVKDRYLDQAEAALTRARQRRGDESELLVLQAYIYQARLGVSPMLRSMKYSGMVNETLAQARKLNPANPRIYLVQANNVYFTPKMFGGGAEAAKPLYDEAKIRYAAFQPSGPLAPNWGERQLQSRLKAYEQSAAPAAAK